MTFIRFKCKVQDARILLIIGIHYGMDGIYSRIICVCNNSGIYFVEGRQNLSASI